MKAYSRYTEGEERFLVLIEMTMWVGAVCFLEAARAAQTCLSRVREVETKTDTSPFVRDLAPDPTARGYARITSRQPREEAGLCGDFSSVRWFSADIRRQSRESRAYPIGGG